MCNHEFVMFLMIYGTVESDSKDIKRWNNIQEGSDQIQTGDVVITWSGS